MGRMKVKRPGRARRTNTGSGSSVVERKHAENLDKLAQFQEFVETIPEDLRKDILTGMKSHEILKKYENMAAARAVVIAMREPDSGKALAAAKDIMDRASGKAVERKQIQHQLHQVSDEEFDALLASELETLDEMESETEDE